MLTREMIKAMSDDELFKLLERFDFDSHRIVNPDTGNPFSAE